MVKVSIVLSTVMWRLDSVICQVSSSTLVFSWLSCSGDQQPVKNMCCMYCLVCGGCLTVCGRLRLTVCSRSTHAFNFIHLVSASQKFNYKRHAQQWSAVVPMGLVEYFTYVSFPESFSCCVLFVSYSPLTLSENTWLDGKVNGKTYGRLNEEAQWWEKWRDWCTEPAFGQRT